MSLNLNTVVNALRKIRKQDRKDKKGKIKNGRYRITKEGKLVTASAGNKNGFEFVFLADDYKPRKPKNKAEVEISSKKVKPKKATKTKAKVKKTSKVSSTKKKTTKRKSKKIN